MADHMNSIPIYYIPKERLCQNYRTITLVGHHCKVIIIIIISLFQEDNIFGTNASLIYGPRNCEGHLKQALFYLLFFSHKQKRSLQNSKLVS